MTTNNEDRPPSIFLYTPATDFVRPYFIHQMPQFAITDEVAGADFAIMISSTAVYDVAEGLNCNELSSVNKDSSAARLEHEFIETCKASGLQAVILRCADIVATGMTGFPRMMANKIYRGTFIGLNGVTGLRSFVHASSLPDAALVAMDKPGIYNVTDRSETSISEFAEALAWRISQKHIFSIGDKWFRFIFGRRKYDDMRRSLTFSCEKLCSAGEYKPTRVIDYLKTHIYDDKSL